MKVSVKNLSDTRVELTILLDSEELAIAEQVAVEKLSRDVKVPGFRKGKTPVAVASKNINPVALHEETLNNAISKAVAEAFTEKKLRALDRPAVEVKKMVPGEMLEFTAEVDILPTVKLGNYKKLKAVVEKVKVADSEINEIIERICKGFASKTEVKRAARMGDEATINFIGKKDGVAFDGGTGNDYPLTLGSGQFIPGFEEGIVGHKAGETFDLDLTFPADYGSAELKGTKVTFTTTLVAVKEVVAPELTDELAAKSGPFKTVDDLKNDIKRELTTQKERELNEKLKDDLVSQLIKASTVPVPEILIADQSESIKKDFVNNLMYRGLSLTQYLDNKGFKSEEEWLEKEVKDAAIKRVQAGLVLAELSKVEKIEATSAELDERLATYRQQYGKSPEALKQFDQPEIRHEIASQLLTEKTVERLVELNTKK
jgi:trigger factor